VRGLGRLAWRTLRARPLRALLTAAGVGLGVAVLLASLATTRGIDAAIDRTVADLVGRAEVRVSAFREGGLTPLAIDVIRGTEGVAVVSPELERRTFLAPPPGASGPSDPVTLLGIEPSTHRRVHDLVLVAGASLSRMDEPSALVTERLAEQDGYVLGGELTLQGAGAPVRVRIVGLIAGGGPFVGSAGRTVIVPLDLARGVVGIDGVTRADVLLEPGAGVAEVLERLSLRLVSEPYVVATPRDLAATLHASTQDVQSTIALIAVIALFVGAFLIFNSLSMTVAERAREVGLLRAAGATRGQVVRFVLSGAIAIGLFGSALGVLAGLGLARAMAAFVGSLRGFPAERLESDPSAILVAFSVGVLVTVAAALEPAVRASRISPVEALRARLDLAPARRARLLWLVYMFALVALVGLLAWPPTAGNVGAGRALAVYAALLAAVLVSPLLLPGLARLVGLPIGVLLRLEERLARGSMARDRSRTALTLGALTVGLAMVVALGWSAQGAKAAASAWLADVIPGDEVVTSIRPLPADEGVAEVLAAVPGVLRVSPIATFNLASHGQRLDGAAVSGADLAADGRLRIVAGDRAAALAALDAGGAAIVPLATADRLGLGLGDRLDVAALDGTTLSLSVVAIAERSIPGQSGESVLVGWADATDRLGVAGADFFAVRFEPEASGSERSELEAAARSLALEPNPLSRVQGAVTAALGRVYGLFDALALVAVLVAALGIVNALAMSVIERIRELGVLRAIGMSRRQASRMVVVEATVIGIVGSVFGAATGLTVGAILLLLGGVAFETAGLPWASLATAAVLGIAVSVVAAWWPARVASRVSIVAALSFE